MCGPLGLFPITLTSNSALGSGPNDANESAWWIGRCLDRREEEDRGEEGSLIVLQESSLSAILSCSGSNVVK